MKRLLLFVLVAMLGACATAPQTPTQIASRVCPLFHDELNTLSQAGLFTGGAQDTLTQKVLPDVDKACASAASATPVTLQSLSTDAAPLLIALVKASSLSADDQSKAVLAIGTIQAMVDVALANVAPTVATAPVAASAVVQ
jgi:hypothetical protein